MLEDFRSPRCFEAEKPKFVRVMKAVPADQAATALTRARRPPAISCGSSQASFTTPASSSPEVR